MGFLLSLATGGLSFLKSIPAKAWIVIGIIVVCLFFWWQLSSAWDKHVKYVRSLEQQTKNLTDQNTRMNAQVVQLSKINTDNQAAYAAQIKAATQARLVAEQERQIAEARATKYRNIRNAAQQVPVSSRHPVSPTVLSTVNRLWDNGSSASGGNQANRP